MRERHPVFRVPGTDLHLVTRHDLVVPILRDVETYSNRFGGTSERAVDELAQRLAEVQADGWPLVSTMLTEDPPAHTRYRGLVNAAFSPRRIAAVEPVVRAIAEELVDRFPVEGTVHFVPDFAVPLPVRVIAHILDVPDDRLDDFKRWSDDSTIGIGARISDDERVRAQRGIVEFQHYFADQLERRRESPRDDVLSTLVNAGAAGGEGPLDMAEMLSIVQQLLVAGNETTTKMLTEGARLLIEHPAEWDRLRADPSRAAAVAEEVLRLSTPTQGMFRVVTRDVELEGVHIPAGSRMVIMYAAANRDPAVFPDPDGFDPDRPNRKEHLAFGKGIHFCIGAPLARLEATVAFAVLAERITSWSFAEGNTFEYEPSFVLRGLKRLDVDVVRSVPPGT
jgi:cytochrome P450